MLQALMVIKPNSSLSETYLRMSRLLENDGDFRLPLVLAQEVQTSIQLVRESCGLLSSHFRAQSPHLGLGPGRSVPLQGQQDGSLHIPGP